MSRERLEETDMSEKWGAVCYKCKVCKGEESEAFPSRGLGEKQTKKVSRAFPEKGGAERLRFGNSQGGMTDRKDLKR